jgi:hypothetical protein
MNRRSVLKAGLAAGAAVVLERTASGMGLPEPSGGMIDPKTLFVGTPVLAEVFHKEGVANALDRMQAVAGINTVLIFSHTHVARQYEKNFAPLRDKSGREITDVWVKTHPEYYDNPALQGKNFNAKYADRDLLDDLHEEIAKRGMQLYARILEPYIVTGAIPGFENWVEVDMYGEKTNQVCFNHPEYIRYWESVINDLIRSHPYLNGFKFGQERGGPMLDALAASGRGKCFCPYCLKLAKERGLDADEARRGLIAFKTYGDKIRAGEKPVDGNFVTFLRLLSETPEIMAWEKFWMDSREEQRKRMFRQIKAINPAVQVGWHIDHGMTWDLITRATWDYSKMGSYSDWLSVALYFDSMGRRSMKHYDSNYKDILFGDASEELSYSMYLSMLGYNPQKQPPLSAHRKHDTAFDTEYVFAECRRVVKDVNGTAKVYARPGFDMPGYDCNVPPKAVYDSVRLAFDAGVDGIWVGREWGELTDKNAHAAGDALRDYLKSRRTI